MTTIDSTTLRRSIGGVDNVRDLAWSGISVGELCPLDWKSISIRNYKQVDGASERFGVGDVPITKAGEPIL